MTMIGMTKKTTVSKSSIESDIGNTSILSPALKLQEPELSRQRQDLITRLSLWAGQLLMQYNAESELVEGSVHRLATALGCDWADISITSNSIILTTTSGRRFQTKARRIVERGINMTVVCEIVRICTMAEKQLIGCDGVARRLRRLSNRQFHYNRWLVVVIIGLSCGCFSRLAGGDWPVFGMTFLASSAAMLVRQEVHKRHLHILINWTLSAFVATFISGMAVAFEIGENPKLAMAASVLLLVPGFPMVNAISDMVKGHISVGWARWMQASMMVLATALGVVLAMNLTGTWGWL